MDGTEKLCNVHCQRKNAGGPEVRYGLLQLLAPSILNSRSILVTAPNESQVTKICMMYHLDVG